MQNLNQIQKISQVPNLFTPIKVGSIQAKNRLFMAPLTRARAGKDTFPIDAVAEYYAQRASAGLIVSEAIGVSRAGLGWPYTAGIWSKAHVDKWKPVTEAVHDKGGKIVCQLWHMGRAAPSAVTGVPPISASATPYPSKMHTYEGLAPPETSKEMTLAEIKAAVEEFALAAENAMRAGFDGVQIHGANGYLVDQFLRDSANKRSDEYGRNPVKFLDEVVTGVINAVGAEQTGVRLSPNGASLGVIDSNPGKLYRAVAEALEKSKVAMVELRQEGEHAQPKVDEAFRRIYKGVLVLNQGYTKETATKEIESGAADAISFGRNFIANPDFVAKLQTEQPLRSYPVTALYSHGPEGYVDFPEGSG